MTRDEISNIHVSVTNTKNKKNARRNLHSLKLSDRRKFQRIVSGVDINVIKDEVKSSEVIMNTYYVNSLEDLLKESKKLINYINYNLPRICKWIYKKARPDVQIGIFDKNELVAAIPTTNVISLLPSLKYLKTLNTFMF